MNSFLDLKVHKHDMNPTLSCNMLKTVVASVVLHGLELNRYLKNIWKTSKSYKNLRRAGFKVSIYNLPLHALFTY